MLDFEYMANEDEVRVRYQGDLICTILKSDVEAFKERFEALIEEFAI